MKGIGGYSAPQIRTEAAPPTPVFVKKALSKQRKLSSASQPSSAANTPGKQTATTPKTKKLFFAMSSNKFQTVLDHSREVSFLSS